MRNLTIAAVLLVSGLVTSCSSTEKELVGSWKRAELLDNSDELTDDNRKGYILELNEDKSFSLKYTLQDRPAFGGSRDRNKKGTWALTSPTMKDDLAALVLRFDDGNRVTEETHRLRSLSKDEMRLFFVDHTSVFRRR